MFFKATETKEDKAVVLRLVEGLKMTSANDQTQKS